MLQSRIVELGEYQPDAPRPVTRVVNSSGLIPQAAGYNNGVYVNKQNPTWGETSAGVGQTDLYNGGICVRGPGARWYEFVGNRTKLYMRAEGWGDTLVTDVTRTSGGDYNTGPGFRWQFEKFGNYVIAVNGNDAPQYFLLGTSTNFAPLSALGDTPPIGKYVKAVGDFLVMGYDNRIAWCAPNDISKWEPGIDLADNQPIPDSGDVKGIVSVPGGFVVGTELNLQAFELVGGEFVFTRRVVNDSVGVAADYAMIKGEGTFFYYSRSGFRQGLEGTPIGRGKVDETFRRKIQAASFTLQNYTFQRNAFQGNAFQTTNPSSQVFDWVSGYYDDTLQVVVWSADPRYYAGQDDGEGAANAAFAYSPAYQKWADSPVGEIAGGWSAVKGEYDEFPVASFIQYTNGNTESEVSCFQGREPWSIEIEWHPPENQPVFVQKIRLVGQFGGSTRLVTAKAYSNRYDGAASPSTTRTPGSSEDEADENTNSWHWVLLRGKYFRFKFQQADDPSGFTEQIVGVEVVYKPAGQR